MQSNVDLLFTYLGVLMLNNSGVLLYIIAVWNDCVIFLETNYRST